jgi:hypothetical protein
LMPKVHIKLWQASFYYVDNPGLANLFPLVMTDTDKWMEKLIRKNQRKRAKTAGVSSANGDDDPFDELNRWFKMKRLDRTACPNPIAWWGVCTFFMWRVFRTQLLC